MKIRVVMPLLACAAFIPSALHAQTEPDRASAPEQADGDIVVTATKTGAQGLQRTPAAVSVITGTQLEQQGINNIRDMAKFVPNVTFAQNTAAAEIYIRGVGTNNVAAGSDPDVTMQVDGVYIARPAGQFTDFFDVARIEVLRGPQGTLYGRNSVGGTINIVSTTPSATWTGRAELVGGNFSLFQGRGYVSGPLAGDTITFSLAGNYERHNPYFDNVVPGGKDVGEADRGGLRGQLRLQITPDLVATTRADYNRSDEYFESYSNLTAPVPIPAPLANSLIGSSKVALNDPQLMHTRAGGVSEDVSWKLGGGFSLRSITAYRVTKYHFTNDNDATEQQIQFSDQRERDRQFSQELNLNYESSRFKGVFGLYYFHDRDFQGNQVLVPPSAATPVARAVINAVSPLIYSTSGAVFAQGSYTLTDRLSITLGGRYTAERKTMDQYLIRSSANPASFGVTLPGFPITYHLRDTYDAFTPKVGLDWRATDNVFAYASITKGYKSGGFNFSAASPALAAFNPETLWSYEAGLKTDWLDRRLRVNLTGFYYDYKNLQVQQLIAPGIQSIGNAATAKVKGAELEITAKPVTVVQLSGNLSYLDARYGRYEGASIPNALLPYSHDPVCAAGICTEDASGNRLNAAPKWSGTAAIDVTPTLGGYRLDLHADVSWRTRTFFDPGNQILASQGSYALINTQIGVHLPQDWFFQIWAENLANKRYFVTVGAPSLAPAGLLGAPRTYGVRISKSF